MLLGVHSAVFGGEMLSYQATLRDANVSSRFTFSSHSKETRITVAESRQFISSPRDRLGEATQTWDSGFMASGTQAPLLLWLPDASAMPPI